MILITHKLKASRLCVMCWCFLVPVFLFFLLLSSLTDKIAVHLHLFGHLLLALVLILK